MALVIWRQSEISGMPSQTTTAGWNSHSQGGVGPGRIQGEFHALDDPYAVALFLFSSAVSPIH